VNREEAPRYGLTVGDVQRTITSGIGGENIAENIEGRERYPISIRYAPDFRDDIQKLERVVIATPSDAQVSTRRQSRSSMRTNHRSRYRSPMHFIRRCSCCRRCLRRPRWTPGWTPG
jgi:Cu/Ag efflux pump CusA